MNHSSRKDRTLSSSDNDRFFANPRSHRAHLHAAFFPLLEMHVRGRPTHSRWQRTLDAQNNLSGGVTHSAHPQNFTGMSVLKFQIVIHDCFPPLANTICATVGFQACASATGIITYWQSSRGAAAGRTASPPKCLLPR